jgi:deoxyribodipyrimidine photo-lyase
VRILIWFRADLRLHDHAPLSAALKIGAEVVPAYCFDLRQFDQTSFGFAKTGALRAQFLRESVRDLRGALRALGSDLILRQGKPEETIAELAQSLSCDAVYFHQEVTAEEVRVERALNRALEAFSISSRSFWGHTLHDVEALPFAVADIPELFAQFRKRVEAESSPVAPLPKPQSLPPLPEVEVGSCPTLEELGLEPASPDLRAKVAFKGGETAGMRRLQSYVWERDRLRVYKETRNGMLDPMTPLNCPLG